MSGFDPNQPRNDDGEWTDGAIPVDKLLALLEPHGFDEGVTPARFLRAREATTRPGFLSPLTVSDLTGKRLILSADEKTGYALTADGDFENLFNNGGPRGAGRDAILNAISRGARTLDAFDGFLPDLYHDYGFVETGRVAFNDEFAPADWDYERYGRPDVVFMAYRGGDRDTIGERVGSFGAAVRAREFAEYDDAKRHSLEMAQRAR